MKVSRHTSIIRVDDDRYLLLNPLTGSLRLVDKDVRDLILNWKTGDEYNKEIPTAIIKELISGGYITALSSAEEDKKVEKFICELRKYPPFYHSIVITYKCNLACKYCFNWSVFKEGTKLNKTITEEYADKALLLIEMRKDNPIWKKKPFFPIALYGGEPLLPETREIVSYIVKEAKTKGYNIAANTNGYFLSDFVDLFKKQKNFKAVGVTLDGPFAVHDKRRPTKEGKGTFNKIVEGIEEARKLPLHIGIRTNVDKRNINSLPLLYEFFEERGWLNDSHFSFLIAPVAKTGNYSEDTFMLSPTEGALKIIDMYSKRVLPLKAPYDWMYTSLTPLTNRKSSSENEIIRPKLFNCPGLIHAFIYDPFGDIYGCPRGVGNPIFKIGRYVPKLVTNNTYEIMKKRTPFNIPNCRACKYALICGGGCAYDAYVANGSFLTGYCDATKALIDYGIPFFLNTLYTSSGSGKNGKKLSG